MPELAFVTGEHQNPLWRDLIAALRHELELQGVRTLSRRGAYPPPADGHVLVIVGPTGYPQLPPGEAGEKILRRAIWLCADPDAAASRRTLGLLGRSAAVFDLHRSSAADLRRGGIASARHLQLGYSSYWEPAQESWGRDIDVLVYAFVDNLTAQSLARLADQLDRRRARIVLVDGAMDADDPRSAAAPLQKLDLLSRARVEIQPHGEGRRHFDWLRAVPALIRGCAVVSEHGLDSDPLQPGAQFVSGRAQTLGALADALLADEARRREMCEAACEQLRELPLSDAVAELASVAERVDGGAPRSVSPTATARRRRATEPVHLPDADPARVAGRRALQQMRLELRRLRRQLDRERISLARGAPPPPVEVAAASTAHAGHRPRVSVITALYDQVEYVEAALDSIAASRYGELEAIVVDDGSRDGSQDVAHAWIAAHDDVPALLLRHPVNAGVSAARNTALAFARGELTMILDADNELLPCGLERLVAALDADRSAAFAYGILQRHHDGEGMGLLSMFPWDPSRLRSANYIDAMALVRTAVLRELGGYTTDPRFEAGWEDYDLWCRMAEQGHRGAFVPELVGRYRVVPGSMVSEVNLSLIDVSEALVERYPKLMVGVDPLVLAGVSP